MRTYSRKRPHNQLIEDVHELCRLCLNKAMEVMPIFSEDNDNICATIALRIMICVGLEVTREDCLPNIICTDCYNELNKYYAFRKKCEVTYQKLKSHVLAVRAKEYKQRLLENEEKNNKLSKTEEELQFVVTFDKDQFVDVNVLNLNGVAQVNSFVDTSKPPNLVNTVYTTAGDSIETNTPEPNPEVEHSHKTESDPEISTFLSTMLIELGILTQRENGLVCTNENIKTIELETGDGSQITFDLMEEDECVEILPKPTEDQVTKEVSNSLKEGEEASQDNEVLIKYITSNARFINKDLKTNIKNNGAWCPECGKRLASRSALSRHLRVHSGEKPYACQRCGRRFNQREVMLRHQLVHEERRPHQCPHCSKSFTQRAALETHARAHAPPAARPLALHRCERCPKVFLYASGLSRHMMMHKGRVYVCGACARQFRDKSALLRHLKSAAHPHPSSAV